MVHALRGCGIEVSAFIEPIAERENVVVVYPDGFKGHFNDCRRVASYAARTANIDDVGFMRRIVDRLVETEAGLLILDYKTNRPPPRTAEEVAPAYIAQLAAYRAALRKLYPERALRAALLWTDGPRLMEISSTSLDAAERRFSDRKCKP